MTTLRPAVAPSGTTVDRRPTQVAAAAVVVAVAVLVLCLWVGDGRPVAAPTGLPDAGAVTLWGLPVVRVLADLAGIVTVGLLVVSSMLVPARKGVLAGSGLRWARAARWTAGTWALLLAVTAVLTLSDLLGSPVSSVLDSTLLTSFLLDIDVGRGFLVQVLFALGAAGAAAWSTTRAGAAAGVVVALAAWLPPTITGHSGSSEQHAVAVSSLMVHVMGMALWCGTLAGALLLVAADRKAFGPALPRLSTLAMWCVVAVGASGTVNALVRFSSPADLVTTSYGWLVVAKAAGLAVLVGFGAWHRKHTLRADREPGRLAFLRVGAVEVLVMAGLVGLAVALSRTPPPVDDDAGLVGASPARLVLGFDLPPAPDLGRLLWGEARADGYTLAVGILVAALYLAGVRTLRRRGDSWPVSRTVLWLGGCALLIVVTNSGLATYARVLFSAHMIEHMLLSMVVPLLLVLGGPVTLALRALPSSPGDRGPREWLLTVIHSRAATLLAHPAVAAGIFVASFYVLYFTPLFPALMDGHWGHVAMTTHFVLTGALFFWVLIGIDPGPRRPPYLARFVILMAVIPLHAFFALAIMSSTSVIAGDYYRSLERPYATDLLADQGLGGGASWAMGEIPVILVLVALFVQWRRSDSRESRAADRAADRAERGDPGARDAHAEYNAYLQRLASRSAAQQGGRADGGTGNRPDSHPDDSQSGRPGPSSG